MEADSGVTGDSCRSEPISPRRRLLEEVLEERSRVVAVLEVDLADPPGSSWRWPFGITRLATGAPGRPLELRRDVALKVAVVALAWMEALDEEIRGLEASPELSAPSLGSGRRRAR